jgi:membrane protein
MIDRVKRLLARLDRWSLSHRTTRVSRRAIGGFMAHDALQFAGSMAYFAVLSIFQLVVLAIVVGSFIVGEGAARDVVLDQVEAGTPLDRETAAEIIEAVIASRGAITIISFAFLLWSALGVFRALSTGVGRAFEAAEPRAFWMDKLLGLFLMAITGVLVLTSLAVGLIAGVLQGIAAGTVGDERIADPLIGLIGFAVPLLLIFVAFWVIYRVVPNRPVRFAEVWPGALVATVLWTLLRLGFTWYATSLANYESAFGPISTAITLLVFLYFASVIVLVGAEFARASVIDDELPAAIGADPRFLPVPTRVGEPAEAPPPPRRGLRRVLVVVAAVAVGIVAGRLSKRDDDY